MADSKEIEDKSTICVYGHDNKLENIEVESSWHQSDLANNDEKTQERFQNTIAIQTELRFYSELNNVQTETEYIHEILRDQLTNELRYLF